MTDRAADGAAFEAALRALIKPLRYLRSTDFATLERVRGLEPTLRSAAERAIALCDAEDAKRALIAVRDGLPAPEASRAERVEQLRACLARLDAIDARGAADAGEPQPPAATSPSGRKTAEPTASTAPRSSRPGGAGGRGVRPVALKELRAPAPQPGPAAPAVSPAAQLRIPSESGDAPGGRSARASAARPDAAGPGALAARSDEPALRSDAPALRSDAPALRSDAPALRSDAPALRSDEPALRSDALAPRSDAPALRSDAPPPRSDAPALRSDAPPPRPDAPVQFLKGVGPRIAELLAGRGIETVGDLLHFLPRRYEDRQGEQRIGNLRPGTRAAVVGDVRSHSLRHRGRRRTLEVLVGDASGTLTLVWFRVPGGSFADRFTRGRRFWVSGEVKRYRGRLQMTHPETRLVGDSLDPSVVAGPEDEPSDAIVPVYLEVEGLRPAQVRRLIDNALPACEALIDPLPEDLRQRRELPAVAEALRALHRPPPEVAIDDLNAQATGWHRRLIYEELFLLQLAVLQRKGRAAAEVGRAVSLLRSLGDTAADLFPFELTGAQRRVLAELGDAVGRDVPMSYLLQGDVGSGKTAVALTLAAAVAAAGEQVAIMAPTELLAEQHARSALQALTPAGIRVELLTGSLGEKARKGVYAGLRSGKIQVVIGTHAIIQESVELRSLALAIIDEQHRFGVMQRGRMVELGRRGRGCVPHMLVMTATPIPRTLALSVYGDLDAAVLDELPPGRTPIRTQLFRERQRDAVYARVHTAVQSGRQAYVVFPLVEESEGEGMEGVRDATNAAEELANGALVGVRVGLLHGRMAPSDKDAVMRRFAAGQIQVLVATTVIEVGIDVPNATVMVIEHAERFGLSQLHQLRGRVGRGTHASECLLVARSRVSDEAWQRLSVMERTADGFAIADADLAIRGPGDFLGTRQAGLPELAVANLVRDHDVLTEARRDAAALLAGDPALEGPDHDALRELLARNWEVRLHLARIG